MSPRSASHRRATPSRQGLQSPWVCPRSSPSTHSDNPEVMSRTLAAHCTAGPLRLPHAGRSDAAREAVEALRRFGRRATFLRTCTSRAVGSLMGPRGAEALCSINACRGKFSRSRSDPRPKAWGAGGHAVCRAFEHETAQSQIQDGAAPGRDGGDGSIVDLPAPASDFFAFVVDAFFTSHPSSKRHNSS